MAGFPIWVNRVLGRFKKGRNERPLPTVRPTILQHPIEEQDDLSALPSGVPPSKTTSTILDKVRNLKNALEFDDHERSRLGGIISSREFLLYIDEVILFKFKTLQKIGILDSESSLAIESISNKLESFLVKPVLEGTDNEEELERPKHVEPSHFIDDKRQSWKVVSGVITEREIELEKERESLNKRITRLEATLRDARIRIKALTPMYEMVDKLRARNSLLNDKVLNQSKILRTLTNDQPHENKLIVASEKLRVENKQLRSKLEEQSTMMVELSTQIASVDPSSANSQLKDLLNEHRELYNSFNEKNAQSELLHQSSDENVADTVERLHEENIRLQELVKITSSISESARSDTNNHGSLSELLTMHNQNMRQSISSKEEQIKMLSDDPQNRHLIKAILGLESDIRALTEENKLKDEYTSHLKEEAAILQSKVRYAVELKKEVRQLKLDLENKDGAIKAMTALELKYQAMRKEYSELRLLNEKLIFERDLANKNVAKLTTEYNCLIKEYGVLFGDLKR